MNDALLLAAYAELRSALANPECPERVKTACFGLSKCQTKLFCTVPESIRAEDATGLTDNARAFDRNFVPGLRLEPSDFLRELLAALRTFEWPRVLVLVLDATSNAGAS
jgi:hypothetical protein